MTNPGRLLNWLSEGLASARPATPDISSSGIAFYYATDTSTLSVWNGSTWITVTSSSIGYLSGLNDQTGTAYTVAPSDAGKDIRCTNASAIALNIDTAAHSSISATGFWALVSQGGAGTVTITALTGVTLRTPNGAATSAQYDARGIEYLGSDEWRVW